MSQKMIYVCDQCKKPIANKKHISLHFGSSSGIAVLPSGEERWSFSVALGGQFLHFCSPDHLATYFKNLMALNSK